VLFSAPIVVPASLTLWRSGFVSRSVMKQSAAAASRAIDRALLWRAGTRLTGILTSATICSATSKISLTRPFGSPTIVAVALIPRRVCLRTIVEASMLKASYGYSRFHR